MTNADCLVWVDCEMTGLDAQKDSLLQIAVMATDANLKPIGKPMNYVIHQSHAVLNTMNDWCKNQFGWNDGKPTEGGLAYLSLNSKFTEKSVEDLICAQLAEDGIPAGTCPIAGNTVHADKRFIDKHMPKFAKFLHYRIVDVSTVKELARRWYPEEFKGAPPKLNAHDALADIKNSIAELEYYQKSVFKARM